MDEAEISSLLLLHRVLGSAEHTRVYVDSYISEIEAGVQCN